MTRRTNTPYPKAFICRIRKRLMNILEYNNRGAHAKDPNTSYWTSSIRSIDQISELINRKPYIVFNKLLTTMYDSQMILEAKKVLQVHPIHRKTHLSKFITTFHSKSAEIEESLYPTLDEKYDAIAFDFSLELEFLLASESHIVVPVCSLDTFEEEFKVETEVFDLLEIDVDLFTYDIPLGTIFDEFRRLSGMKNDLFTYEVEVLEPSYIPCVEQPYNDSKNGNLDIYESRQCYDEYQRMFAEAVILIDDRLVKLIDITLEQCYKKQFKEYMEIKRQLEINEVNTDVECDPTNVDFTKWLASKFNNHITMDWYTKNALWLYWKIGDNEELFTYDELSDLEEENVSEENKILKIFKIETDIFHFETPLCKEFKEFNHLLQIDVDVLTRDLPSFGNYHELDYELMLKLEKYWWGKKGKEESSEVAWRNHLPNDEWEHFERTNHVKTNTNQEWFDNHEPMEDDDDDIGDLDDYLIPNDAPYYVDEEEKRFKKRRSKLLGIPYEKPPTFKSEKFKVIKYSFGPAEEYVAIKEYEYDIYL
ncbi:hypothetical protein Tco_0822823 [Tanacetum coccineum]|uniref:Uncharacterized protein n=1 Tax=Tanacetum coccineum TaxID=301880 RepID=A0ABQ5AI02_9ASTR